MKEPGSVLTLQLLWQQHTLQSPMLFSGGSYAGSNGCPTQLSRKALSTSLYRSASLLLCRRLLTSLTQVYPVAGKSDLKHVSTDRLTTACRREVCTPSTVPAFCEHVLKAECVFIMVSWHMVATHVYLTGSGVAGEAINTRRFTIKADHQIVVAVVVALRGDGVFFVVYGFVVAGKRGYLWQQ